MSETAPAGAASTEAAPAASAVVTPAPETTQTIAPAASDPKLGESLLTSETPAVTDPAAAPAAEVKPETPAETAIDYSVLKLPEGVDANDALLDAFKTAAGEHKITPEAAQALIDKVLPDLSTQIQALRDEPVRLATERLKGWEATIHADPEIGGAKLNEVKTNVARAMAQYGNPDEIKAALNETGAGSNPVLIKWLNKMAQAVGEGTPVTSGNPTFPKASPASRLYDKTPGPVAGQ